MKEDMKGNHTAEEWQEFGKGIVADYRRLYALELKINAIPDEAQHSPEAKALRKEAVRLAVEVVSREEFMEHRRRQGEPAPHFKRPQGTA